MSTPLNIIDLSAAVVGTTGTIDLSNCAPTSNAAYTFSNATLQIHNESGVGLRLSYRLSGGGSDLPAGGWRNLVIPAGENFIDYVVVYVLPQAPVNKLLMTYYSPNEQADRISSLGNSPVNVGNTVLQANQVVSTNQTAPFPVVEATPGASFVAAAQQAIINNDGSINLGAGGGNAHPERHISSDNAGNLSAASPLTLISGNQETGYAGVRADSVTGGNSYGQGVNFKTTMTNTPSSITLTIITSGNSNTPTATNINKQGFFYQASSVASGNMFSISTYTTVGN